MRRRLAALSLLLVAVLPAAVWAGYRIGVAGQFFDTASYWIAGERLYLGDSAQSFELNQVHSIELNDALASDPAQRAVLLAALKVDLAGLDSGEAELEVLLGDTDRILGYLANLKLLGKRSGRVADARSDARRNLEMAEDINRELKLKLELMRLPGRELLPLRDVRSLRLGSLALVISDYRRYLKTGDDIYLKYATEHNRQALDFKQRGIELARPLN